ncbi:hypothetical protein [Halomonas sp. SCS19]|uniref:hypothetical protein n=1 Tax=Halomonas sp. SCS19 TaxID=2950870 RepID=UPI0032DEC988
MKSIYKTQLPQTQIREQGLEEKKLIISAIVNDQAHVAAHPSSLSDVLDFHLDLRSASGMHVLAESSEDALEALSRKINFTIDGVDYKPSTLISSEIQLLKLKFETVDVNAAARSYIAKENAVHGIFKTAEQITDEVVKANPSVAESSKTLASRSRYAISKRAESILTVKTQVGVKTRWVKSGDEVDVDEMLKKGGVYANSLATGGLKTVKGTELLSKVERGIYVAHRRSIIKSNIPFAQHYENIAVGSEQYVKHLKTCINSISKGNIQEIIHTDKVDVLFIDEISQVLVHIFTGSFDAKRNTRKEAYYKLKQLVAKARVVYVADADMNDFVIEFLRSARNDKITLFKSHRNLCVEAVLDTYESTEAAAIKEMQVGRAFVAVDNAKFVTTITEELKRAGKEVVGLTSKNILDHEELIENPAKLRDMGSFIFSPVVTSSVSIVDGGYQNHFGLFSANVTPTDAVQMLRRERTAKRFQVGIKTAKEKKIDNAEALLSQSGADRSDEFEIFSARVEADVNFMKNNIMLVMKKALEVAGFSTSIAKRENDLDKKSARRIKKKAVAHYNDDRLEALMTATPATKSEASKLRELDESSADLDIRVERQAIEKATGKTSLTRNDIELGWKQGALAKQVRLIEIARLSTAKAGVMTYNEQKKSIAARDRFDYISHNENILEILASLNIDLETLTGSFTTEDANELGKMLFESRDAFNKLSFFKKIPAKAPKSFTRAAKDLLKELGLETDKGVTTRRGSKMVNTFTVTEASADRMRTYLNNRKDKGLAL